MTRDVVVLRQASSFPFMLFLSIASHVVLFLLIVVVPEFLPHAKRQPLGGPGGSGGTDVMYVDFRLGRIGSQVSAEREPAPPRYIKKLTKEEEVPLESKTEFPDEKARKKPKNEPTESMTLNQPERKTEGPFGKGKDMKQDAGGQGRFGLGTFGTGGGPGGYGTGTGVAFPFPWYIDTVLTKIEMNWAKPYIEESKPQTYSCMIYFIITKTGTVKDVEVEQSSGILALDRSAQSAVFGSAPFPPLPPQWTEPELAFRVTFTYNQGS